MGILKQVDSLAKMVDDFFPEEMQIKTYEKDANGVKTRVRNQTYTHQLKDAFCLFKIYERLPENANKGYKGKIRELLQPLLENLSLFDIREFSKGLKKFEEEWTMFEEKPKPAVPAGDAQANFELKKGAPKKSSEMPPMDKKEVDKLKKEAGSSRFTTSSFRVHIQKCDAMSWNKRSGRLCYWCIEDTSLAARMKNWQEQDAAF